MHSKLYLLNILSAEIAPVLPVAVTQTFAREVEFSYGN